MFREIPHSIIFGMTHPSSSEHFLAVCSFLLNASCCLTFMGTSIGSASYVAESVFVSTSKVVSAGCARSVTGFAECCSLRWRDKRMQMLFQPFHPKAGKICCALRLLPKIKNAFCQLLLTAYFPDCLVRRCWAKACPNVTVPTHRGNLDAFLQVARLFWPQCVEFLGLCSKWTPLSSNSRIPGRLPRLQCFMEGRIVCGRVCLEICFRIPISS